MDKITELEPRGAALKAELAEYRRRFRTRSIQPVLVSPGGWRIEGIALLQTLP